MRAIGAQGLALIKRFEGFEPQIYLNAAGIATIGYGHVVRAGEVFAGGIDRAEAEALLQQDVQIAQGEVLRLVRVPLSQPQYDALVCFTYNVGGGALQRSTLRRKVNREAHADVPAEFMRWVFAGGRRLRGLVRRRRAEAALYDSGTGAQTS